MSEAAVAVDKPAPAITLVEARMGLSESKRQDWVVDAEEGHTVEQVLDPMYWAHVAPKFTLYDRVEVRVDTGEWMLELIVIQTGRNFARVHVAARHDFTTSPSAAAPEELDQAQDRIQGHAQEALRDPHRRQRAAAGGLPDQGHGQRVARELRARDRLLRPAWQTSS
jgi:hypothetical protein